MIIGIPKEVKNHEYRVGATPSFVRALIRENHTVLVEKEAGSAIGFTDDLYKAAGATIVNSPEDVYEAEMIIKVKEPQPSEYPLLRRGQILYTFLHLAPDPKQTEALIKSEVVAIAYETVTDHNGRLPLLTPMSEVAGRLATQVGAYSLQMANGGRGVLLGGVPGVLPAKVGVIGGGVVGTQAARMAIGLGADVTVFDRSHDRLKELDEAFQFRMKTQYSTAESLEEMLPEMDLVVGAVLIPGKSAPKLVTKDIVKSMKKGSVIVDVAIDQGGCCDTSRPTTHSDPLYVVDDVVHYCVTNMPGACARTSTLALSNATMDYARYIARVGYKVALLESAHLMNGLNVYYGKVTNKPVAEDLGYTYVPPEVALKEA